jgi:hypothetical protein
VLLDINFFRTHTHAHTPARPLTLTIDTLASFSRRTPAQARTLLNDTTLKQMRIYGPGLVMEEVPYGLGLWKTLQLSIYGQAEGTVDMNFTGIKDYLVYEGHAGDDYGTISRQGWHAKLNLSFSIVVNRQFGTWPADATNIHGVYCHVWRVLFEVLGYHEFVAAFSCPQWPSTD